ncbi:siderophore-interacting protein [Gordonia alkaliphila]|uniref:Siderophore-interacting protein n=1 Tax=Gordonia alkaliphila TaxID=1053547 RepID=A0ABP8YS48_9ACTN
MSPASSPTSEHVAELLRVYTELPADYVPRLHVGSVVGTSTVSPGMLRVTLGGDDLRDFPTSGIGDEYVRLFFPDAHRETVWPRLISNSCEYPDDAAPLPMRTYTIRAHRPGEVDIDFVIHPGGIAADWAAAAEPGQQVGITPPRHLYQRPDWAHRQILLADEPALPAALRIAELTAHLIPTTVIGEVRGAHCQIEADTDAAVEYIWLRGSGNGHAPSSLEKVLRRTEIDEQTFVWVASETRINRATRKLLRHDRKRPADGYRTVGYWIDNSEEWESRYAALAPEIRAHLDALYESSQGSEEIVDEVFRIYEAAGL